MLFIEEKITKSQMQQYNKMISKYTDHTRNNFFKFFITIAFIQITVAIIILCFLYVEFLFIIALCSLIIPIGLIIIYNVRRNNIYKALNKYYDKLYNKTDNLIRKYTFDERKLNIEIIDPDKTQNVELYFEENKYYKVIIDQGPKIIVIQFYKRKNRKLVAIKYDKVQEYVKYFEQNNIKYMYK